MKELKIIIPLDKGYGETTEKIKGKINSIIINSTGKSEISINSELGYQIFESKECYGVQYIPIRIQPLDNNGHRINYSKSKFCLNEKILIQVRTYHYKNYFKEETEKQEIKLIIRYDE